MSLIYLSATQLLHEMASGNLSSRDLLEAYIDRFEKLNPNINAIVATDFDSARARAIAADEARKKGQNWGPLHGLPMTIKDTFEVTGMPCTAGSRSLKDHQPKQDALAVKALKDAGAIIFGKTNVPVFASDIQSYNKLYGTTHNPWNPRRTPGGSSGGAAAALAAGLTPVELGSDIGGSIRTPAHFCGIYGHKATHGIIPLRGHIPGPVGTLAESDLAVAGPMARTAADLQLLLDVIATPSPQHLPGWQLKLPRPKQKSLADFRILLWIDDPLCPIDRRMTTQFLELKQILEQAGATVKVDAPAGMSLQKIYPVYLNLLGSLIGAAMAPNQRLRANIATLVLERFGPTLHAPALFENYTQGATQSHTDWLRMNEKRCHLQQTFCQTFNDFDVVLTPIAMTAAFEHLHSQQILLRKLKVDGKKRNYTDLFMWIAPATALGLPATSAPLGLLDLRTPAGIQIIAGPYQDKTCIHFASLLERVMGGFQKPPGF